MSIKPAPGSPGAGAFARLVFTCFLIAITGIWLSACGGGGGGSPSTTPDTELIYGTAASGRAIDGTVSIEDSRGKVISLPVTSGSGQFSASVNDMHAPFMLKVVSSDGATVLYSATASIGRTNISPLTQLALMRVAAQRAVAGPAELFAAPARFIEWLGPLVPAAAAADTMSRLMPAFLARLPGAPTEGALGPIYDPFGATYAVGDAADLALDAYPITFSRDGGGGLVALQTNQASGLSMAVLSVSTALQPALGLAIANDGPVIGGSSVLLSANATLRDGSTLAVPATWTVDAPDGVTIDPDGKLSVPALPSAASATVTARWFDGENQVTATTAVTLLPALRPIGIDLLDAPSAAIAAGTSVTLTAQVRWSDGSVTRPAVSWSWTGDASAVAQLDADGTLRAGRPAAAQDIQVKARFTGAGITVETQAALSVARFMRQVVSVSVGGLAAGQQLTAGDHVDLTLTALWNDGSESALPCAWSVAAASGQAPRISVHLELGNRLVSQAYFLSTQADQADRTADQDIVTGTYFPGDGTSASVTVAFSVKPMLRIPTSLVIRGVTALDEGSSARLGASVVYSDGSTEDTDADWTASDPMLAWSTTYNGAFVAGTYPDRPSAPKTIDVTASRPYTYVDDAGGTVTTTLQASTTVTVNWVEPQLVSLSLPSDLDFLKTHQTTAIQVQGDYRKLGIGSQRAVSDATLNTSDSSITVAGLSLTPTTSPGSPEQSWITLTATATDPATGASVSVSRHVTVALPGTFAKRLLGLPWGSDDADVQFRAIASDGVVDDYTVERIAPLANGYSSNALRRHLPYLSGVTDFTQTQSVANETAYVAAVEQGRVVVMRHEDQRAPGRPALPVALPAGANAAKSVALVVKADALATSSASRLYVLDTAGVVREYRLPYLATTPLAASDVVFERQLPGTFVSISAGAEHLLALRADGSVLAEGSNAQGQIGDPAPGASGWHEAFSTQMQLFSPPSWTSSYATLAGATAVTAMRHASLAATAQNFQGWGVAAGTSYFTPGESELTTHQSAAATKLFSLSGVPRSMIEGAFVQADGSVIFRTALFDDGSTLDGHELFGSGGANYVHAAWLPSVREMVAGRRQVHAGWPDTVDLVLMMPIVRTETDALVYLNGQVVTGANGDALVLP